MLVPLDGSYRSTTILPYALDTAARWRTDVTLLRVVDPSRWDAEARKAQEQLGRIAELFSHEHLQVEADVRAGKPQDEILKAAHDHRADVIVLATRAPEGRRRVAFGSVAAHILRETSLPVLLVKAA
jgi:nucleotide-binding universal stress UspA family protein